MRKPTPTLYAAFALFFFSASMAGAVQKDKVDNTLFATLLAAHVKDGQVDYTGFKADEQNLDQYLKVLEAVAPEKLSENEQMAFYINTYNAWTIKLILSRYPDLKSIKDLGSLFKSPWKKKIVKINGTVHTLDEIEHSILRPRFKDPRVHFAVNCASKGCPPLISEPYEAEKLDRQLESSAAAFVNNPAFNRLDGVTLKVSSIFKWFSEDFSDDITGFFERYAKGDLKTGLVKNKGAIKVKYLTYDWSLNDRPRRKQ